MRAPEKDDAKLSELMLAMDVVDTLRHQEALVQSELERTDRESMLIERLREVYRGQGIAVSDEVLQEGVRAVGQRRFAYNTVDRGVPRQLALIWVHRHLLASRLAAGLVALVLLWLLLR